MIRIRRPATVPGVLAERGAEATRTMLAEAARGTVEFSFNSDLYGHETVKRTLIAVQHGKCAFCEAKFTHVAYGDVEHFRPKTAVLVGGVLAKPGYFWLAYDWDNLLASCQICNQRHKKNLFPVFGTRATYDASDLSVEDPLFIDPAREEPSTHIEFIGAVPHGLTERGRETIRSLGLDRETLNGDRRKELQKVELFLRGLALKIDDPDAEAVAYVQAVVDHLCGLMGEESEYTAMYRAFIRAHPLSARIKASC